MKSKLDAIESRLQAWIENGLAWLPWRSRQPRLSEAIIQAVRSQIAREAGASQPAANILHLFMHPGSADAWHNQPEWQTWLLDAVREMAREAGVNFFAEPELALKSDPELSPREVRLIAAYPAQEVNSTAVMPVNGPQTPEQTGQSEVSAFLIINGQQICPLGQAVINIGRRQDNHVVLDDPRVSRTHAQIRNVRGRYTLFDLNSTGGTYVNSDRISQHILVPGDVISFAGVAVIYGEEPAAGVVGHDTSPARVPPREDPAL